MEKEFSKVSQKIFCWKLKAPESFKKDEERVGEM